MYGDALTTKERIKQRFSLTSTDFDDFLDTLILAVTSRIQSITGRRFIQATYTDEIHDGSDLYGSKRIGLIVKNAPIQTITSVEYKTGLNSSPTWVEFTEDEYDLDTVAGVLYFKNPLPSGKRNIRITYTGGFSGYSLGVSNFWFFNVVPTGAVNGSNRTFTLPETASQIIVYVDGMREASANVTFTAGTDTFTLAVGREPYTSIAVDYTRAVQAEDADFNLPLDLVEVCEVAVVRKFKRRESEGKTTESFQESSITWMEDEFTRDERAVIMNYRRGSFL